MAIFRNVTIAFNEYGSLTTLATIITIVVLGRRLAGIGVGIVAIIIIGHHRRRRRRIFGIWFEQMYIWVCVRGFYGFVLVCIGLCVCVFVWFRCRCSMMKMMMMMVLLMIGGGWLVG